MSVEHPEEELKALIMANTNRGCVIADAHLTGGMFMVRGVCPYAGGSQAVIRLREVVGITLG